MIVQRIIDQQGNDIAPQKLINPGTVDILSLTLADSSTVQLLTLCKQNESKVVLRHAFEPEEQLNIGENNDVTMSIMFEGKPAKIIWTKTDSDYQFLAPF